MLAQCSLCDTGTPAACKERGMSPCQSKKSPHLPPPHFGNRPEELLSPHTQPLLLGETSPRRAPVPFCTPGGSQGWIICGGQAGGQPTAGCARPHPVFFPTSLIHSWDEPVQCCCASCCCCTQQGDPLAESSSPAACSCMCRTAVALLALSTLWVQAASNEPPQDHQLLQELM